MTKHKLKSWPFFFEQIRLGHKKHDLRMKDREFKVGDMVMLCEYDPFAGTYTGRALLAKITYITSNDYPCAYSSAVLDREACILSLELIKNDVERIIK